MTAIQLTLQTILIVLVLVAVFQVRKYVSTLLDLVQAMADNMIAKNNLVSTKNKVDLKREVDKVCMRIRDYLGTGWNIDANINGLNVTYYLYKDGDDPIRHGCILETFTQNDTVDEQTIIDLYSMINKSEYFKTAKKK